MSIKLIKSSKKKITSVKDSIQNLGPISPPPSESNKTKSIKATKPFPIRINPKTNQIETVLIKWFLLI